MEFRYTAVQRRLRQAGDRTGIHPIFWEKAEKKLYKEFKKFYEPVSPAGREQLKSEYAEIKSDGKIGYMDDQHVLMTRIYDEKLKKFFESNFNAEVVKTTFYIDRMHFLKGNFPELDKQTIYWENNPYNNPELTKYNKYDFVYASFNEYYMEFIYKVANILNLSVVIRLDKLGPIVAELTNGSRILIDFAVAPRCETGEGPNKLYFHQEYADLYDKEVTANVFNNTIKCNFDPEEWENITNIPQHLQNQL